MPIGAPGAGAPGAGAPGAPAGGALEARVAACYDTLSQTERRIARFFLEHCEEVAFVSAADIARQLATSDASVVRAAQRLGYAGLPELKRELVSAFRNQASHTLRLGRRLEHLGEGSDDLLDNVVTEHVGLIEEVRQTVAPEDVRRAIDLLAGARRILIFGIGPSAALATHTAVRLGRFGREAIPLTHTGLQLADALVGMRRGDVLVVMAYGRILHDVEVTVQRAAEVRVPVVLLTDSVPPQLGGRVRVALRARRGRAGALGSLVTTLVLLDALSLGLASRDRPRALGTLETLNDLRARLVGERVDLEPVPEVEAS